MAQSHGTRHTVGRERIHRVDIISSVTIHSIHAHRHDCWIDETLVGMHLHVRLFVLESS